MEWLLFYRLAFITLLTETCANLQSMEENRNWSLLHGKRELLFKNNSLLKLNTRTHTLTHGGHTSSCKPFQITIPIVRLRNTMFHRLAHCSTTFNYTNNNCTFRRLTKQKLHIVFRNFPLYNKHKTKLPDSSGLWHQFPAPRHDHLVLTNGPLKIHYILLETEIQGPNPSIQKCPRLSFLGTIS